MATGLLRSASGAAKGYGCSQQPRRRRAGGDLAARLIPLVEQAEGGFRALFLPGVTAVTVRTPLTMYPIQCIGKLKTETLATRPSRRSATGSCRTLRAGGA